MQTLSRPHSNMEANDSGFGLFQVDGSGVRVARSARPAHADPLFERTVREMERARANCPEGDWVVEGSHVRLATAARIAEENSHPFRMVAPGGRETVWMMNGTVAQFADHADKVLREVDPEFRAQVLGQTDAESALGLYLTHLKSDAKDPSQPEATEVAAALRGTVRTLAQIANRPGGEKSAMNFVVTDGNYVGATRYRRTLVTSDRLAPHSTVPLEHGARTNGLVFASQPWDRGLQMQEVPEATVSTWTAGERRLFVQPMGDERVLPLGEGPIP